MSRVGPRTGAGWGECTKYAPRPSVTAGPLRAKPALPRPVTNASRKWVEGKRGKVKERGGDKRERDLRLGRERMRRGREFLKSKGEEGKGICREETLITSVPPLGVYPGRRRKVLGELRDGGNRRKG